MYMYPTLIAFFSLVFYRSSLYVLTTRVTVSVCHTEIKGYLHTYLRPISVQIWTNYVTRPIFSKCGGTYPRIPVAPLSLPHVAYNSKNRWNTKAVLKHRLRVFEMS